MFFNRNSTAIIFNTDGIIFMHHDINDCTITSHRFIDTVIDNFINQLMQSIDTCIADIHSWTFTNGLQPF